MDYKNGRIYKLISDATDKVYIGSTTQPLSKRLSLHKYDYKRFVAGKFNRLTSFNLIELGPVQIVLIELFPCETREELEKRECYYINLFKDEVVNKVHPTRTRKQYLVDNAEAISEQMKQYYVGNKKAIIEQHKHYYKQKKLNQSQSPTISISQSEFDVLVQFDLAFKQPLSYNQFLII
tara:strand:- start:69 stop:605 length:537 start_codon:yes stop_codon:yes gene_type:complete